MLYCSIITNYYCIHIQEKHLAHSSVGLAEDKCGGSLIESDVVMACDEQVRIYFLSADFTTFFLGVVSSFTPCPPPPGHC